MQIEIVEFYPIEENKAPTVLVYGTLHVYLCDLNLDLRGINVMIAKNKRNKLFVRLPSKRGIDPVTNKECFYPLISFTDTKKQKEMISTIQKLGLSYIRENFLKLPKK